MRIMQNKYKYFAFISFQSADAKEAARLQHTIESYRLPAVLCKQDTSIPRRIRPLYCYLNDMHAGEELMQELKQRMEQSRYLIVVCSPRAAQSTYINSGIDYFVSLGRRDSIIPIIVDGVPYSGDPKTECFPEALCRHFPKHTDPLQDHSILGINIHEEGVATRKSYGRAMLMVVARMLQLDFDGLLLREQQRRRKRTILTSLLTIVIMISLGLTWWLSQTVDVAVRLQETTPNNNVLPPCREVVLRLTLDNEQKTDTLASINDIAWLTNIPPRYIGRKVRMELKAKDYMPLDTMVLLQHEMLLPMTRNAAIYGHVHFHVVGLSHPDQVKMRVGKYSIQPSADGLVELDIPIDEQQPFYQVTIDNQLDTLYMPCGEDVVMLLP